MKVLILLVLLLAPGMAFAPTSGSTTCPTSGNKRVVTASKRVPVYSIQAPITNVGTICWGDSAVTTGTAPCLSAGMSYTAQPQGNSAPYDLSTVFFACSANTDVLKWTTE